jgi:hypothetical protein
MSLRNPGPPSDNASAGPWGAHGPADILSPPIRQASDGASKGASIDSSGVGSAASLDASGNERLTARSARAANRIAMQNRAA